MGIDVSLDAITSCAESEIQNSRHNLPVPAYIFLCHSRRGSKVFSYLFANALIGDSLYPAGSYTFLTSPAHSLSVGFMVPGFSTPEIPEPGKIYIHVSWPAHDSAFHYGLTGALYSVTSELGKNFRGSKSYTYASLANSSTIPDIRSKSVPIFCCHKQFIALSVMMVASQFHLMSYFLILFFDEHGGRNLRFGNEKQPPHRLSLSTTCSRKRLILLGC